VTRPAVDVRQAGACDADDLLVLWVQARAEISGPGRPLLGASPDAIRPRLLDALTRREDLHILLARWEGRPAGFAVVRVGQLMPVVEGDCVELEHLYVTALLRRHGVGRALLAGVAAVAERHGADQILSGAPPSAREVHRFLARLGFTPLVLRRVVGTAILRRRLAGESTRSALEDLLSRRRSSRARSSRAATPPAGLALAASDGPDTPASASLRGEAPQAEGARAAAPPSPIDGIPLGRRPMEGIGGQEAGQGPDREIAVGVEALS
jgi:GNAT superfamily N-acetyltransferase